MLGRTYWYLWYDGALDVYKHGDHFVNPRIVNGVDGDPTPLECDTEIRSYLSSSGYLGRMAKARAKKQIIHAIVDVTDYAKKHNSFGANKQIDATIENRTILKNHRLTDKDSLDPKTISHDEIIRVFNEEVFGAKKLHSFPMYDKQQEACDKAVDYFNNGNKHFLLDCVMRFGKCFTSYNIAKRLNAKKILVVTGRPKVKTGWKDDLDHVDFNGWNFIDSQTTSNVSFQNSNTNPLFTTAKPDTEVIFASLQGGARSTRSKLKSRIKDVIKQNIDLVIVDELHAYYSEDALKFINNLNADKILWVSGTPFKAYESGDFNGITDTYRFTIMDLQRERAAGHPRFKEFPELRFWVAKYPKFENSTNFSKIFDEQGLNMNLLLSNSSGVPNYPMEVNEWLNSFKGHSIRQQSVFGLSKREVSTISGPVLPKHIWIAVPPGKDDDGQFSVAAGRTLETIIPQHHSFKTYTPLLVTGQSGIDQDAVIRHMTQHSTGTAIISCGSLNTGTKFEQLEAVIFARETQSASEFWQTVGRALNPCAGKKYADVIIGSAQFIVNMADEMCMAQSGSSSTSGSHRDMMYEFFSLMPTHVIGEGSIEQLLADAAYRMLKNSNNIVKTFKSDRLFASDIKQKILNDIQFAMKFPKLDEVISESKKDKRVALNNGISGKNKKTLTQKQKLSKQKTLVEECLTIIKDFMSYSVSIQSSCIVNDSYKVKSLSDLINAPERPIDTILGSGSKQLIVDMINRQWLNQVELDRRLAHSYECIFKDIS
jgi:superfamily II DNA or RNA helicase